MSRYYVEYYVEGLFITSFPVDATDATDALDKGASLFSDFVWDEGEAGRKTPAPDEVRVVTEARTLQKHKAAVAAQKETA